jgi:hypothetical protein
MRLRIIGFLCALVLFQCFARAGSTLYVTSSLNTVVRVNSLNSNTDIATGLNDPYDIVYHNGKLYVTESSGASVLTMDITGANRQVFATTAANSVPAGLAFGPDGGLYIADLTNNRIEKTFGGTTTLFASGLNGPEGLAFDSGGNLYVADFYSNSIVKIDPSGATYPFASIHLPADVAFDRFGQMYVSSYHDDIIYKVSPLGVVTPFAINLGLPNGISFDYDNAMYVTSQQANGIKTVSPSGVVSTFANFVYSPHAIALVPEPAALAALILPLVTLHRRPRSVWSIAQSHSRL